MKWIKNIEEFTEHIFSNKERAAKRHLNNTEVEKPREIFDRACQLIADELTTIGFQYFQRQHRIKIESADRKYTLNVSFSSNRDNVAGQYIELSSVFYIESNDLKKFSKKNPLLTYWNETMIGRDIGTLIDGGEGNLVWNLADKKEFDNAVTTISKTVKERLVNLFKDFQDTELMISQIEKNNFELNTPMTTVQYLLMLNHKTIAEKYLSEFLTRKPDKILSDYKKAIIAFQNGEIPTEFVHGMGYGHEIALLEKVYELKITVPNTKASCGRNDPARKCRLNRIPDSTSVKNKMIYMEKATASTSSAAIVEVKEKSKERTKNAVSGRFSTGAQPIMIRKQAETAVFATV